MDAAPSTDAAARDAKAKGWRTFALLLFGTSACLFVLTPFVPVVPCEGGGFCVVPWWLVTCGLGAGLFLAGIFFAGWAWAVRRAPP